jgi:hypothetical protein
MEDLYGKRDQGLKTGDPEGCPLKTSGLLFSRMRGMVCGDDIDGAVEDPTDEGLTVFSTPQWRVHLIKSIITWNIGITQSEMVRSHFTGYFIRNFFEASDEFQALFGRDMTEVESVPFQKGQRPVPVGPDIFRGSRDTRQSQFTALLPFMEDPVTAERKVFGMGEVDKPLLAAMTEDLPQKP